MQMIAGAIVIHAAAICLAAGCLTRGPYEGLALIAAIPLGLTGFVLLIRGVRAFEERSPQLPRNPNPGH